ncbi:MAG TPA: methyltransferase [Mycobacterium sp.]|nr:methyltransferase [Mycobacterium sp.]
MLCDIRHDWDDQHAQQILTRCADAARPDSRILVIEAVGDRHPHTAHDLAMLVFYGGRDRHLHELSALAEPLGLLIDAVTDVSDHRTLVELRPSADTARRSNRGAAARAD